LFLPFDILGGPFLFLFNGGIKFMSTDRISYNWQTQA